jgi:magnesium-transporting ATPase (P-type)
VFESEEWQNIEVGDIVHLCDGDDVPADMIVLSTSEPQAVCYVETKNLDGETNLKERRGLKRTEHLTTAEGLSQYVGLTGQGLYILGDGAHALCEGRLVMTVHAEAPTRDLYTFSAKLTVGDAHKSEAITADSLLLRGCKIRNSAHVYALVLYTGVDTKIVMNSGVTPLKRTKLEKTMNGQVRHREGSHPCAVTHSETDRGRPSLSVPVSLCARVCACV